MIIYEVFDEYWGEPAHYRNLKDAKRAFSEVEKGHIHKLTIPSKITKDVVINLLNREGYVYEQEEVARK